MPEERAWPFYKQLVLQRTPAKIPDRSWWNQCRVLAGSRLVAILKMQARASNSLVWAEPGSGPFGVREVGPPSCLKRKTRVIMRVTTGVALVQIDGAFEPSGETAWVDHSLRSCGKVTRSPVPVTEACCPGRCEISRVLVQGSDSHRVLPLGRVAIGRDQRADAEWTCGDQRVGDGASLEPALAMSKNTRHCCYCPSHLNCGECLSLSPQRWHRQSFGRKC